MVLCRLRSAHLSIFAIWQRIRIELYSRETNHPAFAGAVLEPLERSPVIDYAQRSSHAKVICWCYQSWLICLSVFQGALSFPLSITSQHSYGVHRGLHNYVCCRVDLYGKHVFLAALSWFGEHDMTCKLTSHLYPSWFISQMFNYT